MQHIPFSPKADHIDEAVIRTKVPNASRLRNQSSMSPNVCFWLVWLFWWNSTLGHGGVSKCSIKIVPENRSFVFGDNHGTVRYRNGFLPHHLHITISKAGSPLAFLEKLSVRLLPLRISPCFPQRLVCRNRHRQNRIANIRIMGWIDIEKHVDDKEESKCSNSNG